MIIDITSTTNKDTENLADTSQTGTITSVTGYIRCMAFGASSVEKAVIVWRTHSTNYEGVSITISRVTFTTYSQARDVNPFTSAAWTWTEVNALELGIRAYALGSTEEIDCSEFWIVVNYTAGDVTSPTYSNLGTNTTIISQPCLFYSKWTDETGLATTGGYIFGTNNTGSWVNETWTAFTANPDWGNKTKTLNSTMSLVVQWQVWANDTSNNWNNTGTQFLVTTAIVLQLACAGNPDYGIWANYTTNSVQPYTFCYVNITANAPLSAATLHWYNSSGWTDVSMAASGDYFTKNVTSLAVWSGYTFNITATSGSTTVIYNHTKLGLLGETLQRTFAVGTPTDNLNYTIHYMLKETYTQTNNVECHNHDQGTDGSTYDTGVSSRYNFSEMEVYCSFYCGFYLDITSCINNTVLNNLYISIWWTDGQNGSSPFANTTNYLWYGMLNPRTTFTDDAAQWASRAEAPKPQASTAKENYTIYIERYGANMAIMHYVALVDVGNITLNSNNMYRFAIMLESASNGVPTIRNNATYPYSFFILNLPSNATLSGLDTDEDGNSDFNELFVNWTDPIESIIKMYSIDLTLSLSETWSLVVAALYSLATSLSLGESWTILFQTVWNLLPQLSLTASWTVLTQTLYSLASSFSLTESWTLLASIVYNLLPGWSLTEGWTVVTVTLFNVVPSLSLSTTWTLLSQSTYGLAVSLSQSFEWLITVIRATHYFIDLALAFTVSWSLLTQSMFSQLPQWSLGESWAVASQSVYAFASQFSLTESWTLLTRTAYALLPSFSLTETWATVTQVTYKILPSWSLTEIYSAALTVFFNVAPSWSLPAAWTTVTQSVYGLAASFSQSFQWLVEVTRYIAPQFYSVDLTLALGESWTVLVQTAYKLLPQLSLTEAFITATQAVYSIAHTWQTTQSWTVLTQTTYSLVQSFSQSFQWLVEVTRYIAPQLHVVDLTLALTESWAVLTQNVYGLLPQLQLVQSWTILTQTVFKLAPSWQLTQSWVILTQTTYGLATSLTQTFSWLVEVTWFSLPTTWIVDLTWLTETTWTVEALFIRAESISLALAIALVVVGCTTTAAYFLGTKKKTEPR
jgi:hypothetical protein